MLLEQYDKARGQIMEGLSLKPFNEDLQKALLEVKQHLAGSRSNSPAPPQQTSLTSSKRYSSLPAFI